LTFVSGFDIEIEELTISPYAKPLPQPLPGTERGGVSTPPPDTSRSGEGGVSIPPRNGEGRSLRPLPLPSQGRGTGG